MSLIRVRRLVLAMLVALGLLPLASATLAAQSGAITGRVTDAASGQPIENAQVQAQLQGGVSYGAISGADGTFRVINLPDGTYTVTVRRIGYGERAFTNLRPGANVQAALSGTANVLEQIVTTSTRGNGAEKVLDSPNQISVITSERIAERPVTNFTDHLTTTPGISINKGGLAQANVVARGFNNAFSGSMLMLQDYRFAGVPSLRVNVPFLATGTNEDIERIEVLLGPASALYGPNSSAGVLHVITKSPFNSIGTTVSVDGGERSVIRTGLRHAGKLNDKVAYKVSGEYLQGKDWEYNDRAEPRVFPGTANVPESRRGQANQRDFDLQRFSGEARVDLRPADGVEAITTLGYTNVGSGLELTGANGTAQIKNWTYTSLQQRFRWNRLFAQVFYNASNAGNDTLTSSSGTYLLRSGQPIVDKSRVASAQIQHGFNLSGERQSFTYGLDYIWTNPQTGGTINGGNEDDDNVTEYGAYLQSTTRPNRLLELQLAARVDANNVIEGNFFSPRAALIFKPVENQNFRVTYNRSFSTPANFSFFLDLIQSPNVGGSGFDIRARGNPPKAGFAFRQDCAGGAFGSFCMKSPYAGQGGYVTASAAAALPGFITAREQALVGALTAGLQQQGVPATLAPALAQGAVNALKTLQPTDAQLATRVSYLNAPTTALTPAGLTPIRPLEASFNETYEAGWKGILGDRFRYDIAFWGQQRGEVATTAALATPNVFFGNPQQLGGLIGGALTPALAPALQQAGLTAQQIQALLTGLTTSLTTTIASAPVGVVTFDDPNTAANAVYATYQAINKKIWVRGIDIATDIVATEKVTFDASFSFQNQNLWKDITVGGIPFMSNSPRSRGSLGMRYNNTVNGLGFELRSRYSESYPVNSGVYATNTAYVLGAGQEGAPTAPPTRLGYGQCAPAATGAFCYENVPESFLFDAMVSKRFDVGSQKLTWSINATNIFDNRIRTFPGVPEVGRLILTRLQYTF